MSKLNLGVGRMPIKQSSLDIMGDVGEWTLVDKYVQHPDIQNWDAEQLKEVPNGSVDIIYASQMLEYVSHRTVVDVLEVWFQKLKEGGKLIITVPDMEWVSRQIIRFESGQILSGIYTDFEGKMGLQSIVYGTNAHEGEYRKSCFTRTSLWELLDGVGYEKIKIEQKENEDEIGILLATCYKL